MRKLFNLLYNLVEYLFFPMTLLYAALLMCYFVIGAEFTTVLLWMGIILLSDLLLLIMLHVFFHDDGEDYTDDEF